MMDRLDQILRKLRNAPAPVVKDALKGSEMFGDVDVGSDRGKLMGVCVECRLAHTSQMRLNNCLWALREDKQRSATISLRPTRGWGS